MGRNSILVRVCMTAILFLSSGHGLTPGIDRPCRAHGGQEHTAPRVGSGKVHVLATPVMINLIEAAALEAIEHLLPPGYQSLGTHLDVHHVAATPVGMKARATAEVTKVDGRTVTSRSRRGMRKTSSATALTSAWW